MAIANLEFQNNGTSIASYETYFLHLFAYFVQTKPKMPSEGCTVDYSKLF